MTEDGRMNLPAMPEERRTECLYHVTDSCNLESIIENGGLCSWRRTGDDRIDVACPGGDAVSHRLDRRNGRDTYVHLFLRRPSKDVLDAFTASGRMSDPFVLEISAEVLSSDGVLLSSGDPYDGTGRLYDDICQLESVPPSSLPAVDVRDRIPLRFITNMPKEYTSRISKVHPTAIVFIIDHSRSMALGTRIQEERYDYRSEFAALLVNRQIDNLMKRCLMDGELQRLYDIAVIGYGDDAYSAWDDELEGRGFLSPAELLLHRGEGDYRWVQPRDDGDAKRCDLAFAKAGALIREWMSRQESMYFYPPTVIHISSGAISARDQSSFIKEAESLKAVKTNDGHVIVWNIYISQFQQREITVPNVGMLAAMESGCLDLYETSSFLPERLSQKVTREIGGDADIPRKAICVNTGITSLATVFDCCILPDL